MLVSGHLVAAGFLIIHLNKNADLKKIASACAKVPSIAKEVADGEPILAGVAFGTNTYEQLCKSTKTPLPENHSHYRARKGTHGAMPATGGDILLHVKAVNKSHCFEVIKGLVAALPPGSIASIDDEYGFHFQDSRDLSGFIDGTENISDAAQRREVALLPTGGSYVIHQRYANQFFYLN